MRLSAAPQLSTDSLPSVIGSEKTPDIVLPIQPDYTDTEPRDQDEGADSDTAPMAFRPEFFAAPEPATGRNILGTPEHPTLASTPVDPEPDDDSSAVVAPTIPSDAERAGSERLAAKAAARRAVRRAQLAQSPQAVGVQAALIDVLILDNQPELVFDNQPDPGFLCNQLEAFGFRVHQVGTSERAISMMRDKPLVATFLDLVLPDADDTDGAGPVFANQKETVHTGW